MKLFSWHMIQFVNACTCLFICMILAWVQLIQLYFFELPCPLCLLQRVGFIGMAVGFLWTLDYGPKRAHYLIVIISALFTLSVGLRQVLLHIVPNTGAYGSALMGYHLYTWSVIVSAGILLWLPILFLLNPQQFTHESKYFAYKPLFLLVSLIVVINIITNFAICGFNVCPSGPVQYIWQR